MRRAALVAASVVACSATVVGCAGSRTTSQSRSTTTEQPAFDVKFVPAARRLIAACRTTARAVGYRVPCPTRVPAGLTQTSVDGRSGCTLGTIGPGGAGGCAKSWRGWVVGSSNTPTEHLVITASPTRLRNYAKVVNGPAWYSKARVEPLGWLTVNGWRTRIVLVPQATNDGSAFADHVVLIWTVGQHTYGVGFHNVRGVQPTVRLDEELVKSIRLVGP